jgi:hypothetical protein
MDWGAGKDSACRPNPIPAWDLPAGKTALPWQKTDGAGNAAFPEKAPPNPLESTVHPKENTFPS